MKTPHQFIIATSLFLIFILISCQQAKMDQVSGNFSPQQVEATSDQDKQEKEIERKVIKEGLVEFETGDLEKSGTIIRDAVSDLKGYISRENMYESDHRISMHLTVRVPASSFDGLVELISKEAGTFDRKEISSQDVTEQFIDLETRLSTKKEIEARYVQLLGKANSVEEVLAIEKEIGALREDVESMEGRFRYLKNRVGFSTLDVRFYKKQDQSFFTQFVDAVKEGWYGIAKFVLILTYIWPFLILLGIGYFLFQRFRNRRKQS